MNVKYEKDIPVKFGDLDDKASFFSNNILYLKILPQDLKEYNIDCVNAISLENHGLTKFDNDEHVIKAKVVIDRQTAKNIANIPIHYKNTMFVHTINDLPDNTLFCVENGY